MLPGAIWHGHFLLCPACPARTPRWTHPGSSGSEVQLFFNPMNIWYQMSNTDPKLTKLFKWVSVCKRFFLLGFAACLVWGTLGLKGRTQIQATCCYAWPWGRLQNEADSLPIKVLSCFQHSSQICIEQPGHKKRKQRFPRKSQKTQSNFQHVFLLPSLIGFLNSQWKFPSRWKNQSNSRGGFQDPEFHGLLRRYSKFDRFFKFPMKILTRNPIPDFDWVFMVLL